MHTIDKVTFELSKKQAGRIYRKLQKARIFGFKYSVIKNGIGGIAGTVRIGITRENSGQNNFEQYLKIVISIRLNARDCFKLKWRHDYEINFQAPYKERYQS